MERLWSPWRMQYLSEAGGDGGCFLCRAAEPDGDALYGSELSIIVLNAFPYNTGHVMVAPRRHAADLRELDEGERTDLMEQTTRCVAAIADAMSPEGFNVGINMGAAAGAGVPGHLHVHVVPRWSGDTNFMPVVGDTKVLPEMLEETAAKLRPVLRDES